jgi:hypothetical protein
MTLQEYINTYRIATGGNYNFRLEEARLFILDANEAGVSSPMSYIRSNAAVIYDVCITDI